MKETPFRLALGNRKALYGTLNRAGRQTEAAIVFVHGLTGHQHEHIFFNAARYFPENDIATIRFNLYSDEPDARKLDQCTLKTHAKDLNKVVAYARRRFKRVYLVGHSLGGPTIFLSDTSQIKGAVLWDPAINLRGLVKACAKFEPALETYVINWEVKHLWGLKMPKECLAISDCTELSESMKVPMQVIAAGRGNATHNVKRYIEVHPVKGEYVEIQNASHNFNEPGSEKKLFEATLKWIKKLDREAGR
jgi:dienelactone hydrolase